MLTLWAIQIAAATHEFIDVFFTHRSSQLDSDVFVSTLSCSVCLKIVSHSIRFYLSCSICFLFVNLLKTINIVLLMVNFGTYQFWFSHLVKIHVNDFLNSSILSTSALEYRLAWLYVRIINCLLAFGRSSYSVSDSLLGATLRFLLIGERCFYEILNF